MGKSVVVAIALENRNVCEGHKMSSKSLVEQKCAVNVVTLSRTPVDEIKVNDR
jgi:hypothetical protein